MPALVVAFLLTNTLKQNALFLLLSRALSPSGDSLGDFYHLVSSAENVIKKSFAIIFFSFFSFFLRHHAIYLALHHNLKPQHKSYLLKQN